MALRLARPSAGSKRFCYASCHRSGRISRLEWVRRFLLPARLLNPGYTPVTTRSASLTLMISANVELR